MSLNRRRFVKNMTLSTAGVVMGGLFCRFFPDQAGKSTVFLACSNGLKRLNNNIDKSAVTKVLNQAIMGITGESTPGRAWKKLFSPRQKVGIKLSCLPSLFLSLSDYAPISWVLLYYWVTCRPRCFIPSQE